MSIYYPYVYKGFYVSCIKTHDQRSVVDALKRKKSKSSRLFYDTFLHRKS